MHFLDALFVVNCKIFAKYRSFGGFLFGLAALFSREPMKPLMPLSTY